MFFPYDTAGIKPVSFFNYTITNQRQKELISNRGLNKVSKFLNL